MKDEDMDGWYEVFAVHAKREKFVGIWLEMVVQE
jgi:hypothetical protein